MGAVKQHFHEEISAREAEYEPTPQDYLEMTACEIERAIDRFLEMAERFPDEARAEYDALTFGTDKLELFLKMHPRRKQ